MLWTNSWKFYNVYVDLRNLKYINLMVLGDLLSVSLINNYMLVFFSIYIFHRLIVGVWCNNVSFFREYLLSITLSNILSKLLSFFFEILSFALRTGKHTLNIRSFVWVELSNYDYIMRSMINMNDNLVNQSIIIIFYDQ